MSERNEYPAGVPCWVDTLQPDPVACMRFYAELFEWEFAGPGPMPDGSPAYYVARVRNRDVAGVGSQPLQAFEQRTVWNTHIAVASADETARKVQRAGGRIVVGPFDALPAGRIAVLQDPAGAVFCAWEPRERVGAQIVNEPRAWAMSVLNTRDTDGSIAFYRDVFGWEPQALDFEEAKVTLFCLPGYVGGEPQQPVPRDVVAVMASTGDEQFPRDAQPHWSVDFWVENAQAVAEKAFKHGGKVVVPLHEVAGFRRAMIADPQGAIFTISQLTMMH